LLHLALDSLIPYAEMRRVTLAFKPVTHSRADCSIITNWRDALTLVREVNHSALKLVYDAYYWAVDDKAVDEAAGLVEHLALVQLSDDVSLPSRDEYRRPIGQGNRLLRDLISSLSAAGYDGDYEINLLGSPVAPGIYTEMLTESRAVCNAWFQESNVITA
jgi:sugar phosphate isomerase/epimerase